MKIGLFNFKNYGRTYSYYVEDNITLRGGHFYNVETEDGTNYKTSLHFIKYAKEAPQGVQLKTITKVEEVEDD